MSIGNDIHHVVVAGAGFGGLEVVRRLHGPRLKVTVIDRRNHHLFQPLLYQVATAVLAVSEIAWPIRHLLSSRREVTTLLAEVVGVDMQGKQLRLENGSRVGYDTLVIATGARHAYFGHDEWEAFAPGLKSLEDATALRRRVLLAFEKAELEPDSDRRAALLSFAIIGGGPTGVELAGAIAELAKVTLRRDYRRIDPATARISLIEAGDRLLPAFPPKLSSYASEALISLGVEVHVGHAVHSCDRQGVAFGDRRLPAATVIWAAGVAASNASDWLAAPSDRAGRVKVEPDLTVPGHPDIFVIGDTALVYGPTGTPVPGIAPAAKQQGRYVAKLIMARLSGAPVIGPFRYKHAGNLATIGKRRAVIDFGWIRLRGALAWWMWGVAHIFFLIGVRNRLSVALNWLWIHTTGQRSALLITGVGVAASEDGDTTAE